LRGGADAAMGENRVSMLVMAQAGPGNRGLAGAGLAGYRLGGYFLADRITRMNAKLNPMSEKALIWVIVNESGSRIC